MTRIYERFDSVYGVLDIGVGVFEKDLQLICSEKFPYIGIVFTSDVTGWITFVQFKSDILEVF